MTQRVFLVVVIMKTMVKENKTGATDADVLEKARSKNLGFIKGVPNQKAE